MELQFQSPRFLISQAAPINEPLSIDNFVYVYLKKSTFCAILRKLMPYRRFFASLQGISYFLN